MRKIYLFRNLLFLVSFLLCGYTYAQSVSGTISDANGPLPGASILVKGSANGTTTDFDGNFTLNNVATDAVLTVSYMGYISQEVSVGGKTTINVTLIENASQLDEVVVVGYTSQVRGDVTGSISSVDVDEALAVPVVNASEALQGRVSGVTVTNSGSPGSAPKINIRGFGTTNNTNPLYIIDGVQTDDAGVLNNINPADIEQMNVLKDGAAAIYGARASNGVIIITTKSGGYNMDEAKVTFDFYTGYQKITNAPGVLNAGQHAQMLYQSYVNDGLSPVHAQYDPSSSGTFSVPSQIQGYRRVVSYDPIVFSAPGEFSATVNPGGTDWLDAITSDAPMTNASLSMENGGENGKYFMSVGYLEREGLLNYTGFKRISTRLNSEFKALDGKITFGEHVNISFSDTNSGVGEAIENTYRITPLLPVKDDHGYFTGVAGPDLSNTRNPAAQLYRAKDNYNKRYAVTGDVYMSYKIMDELTFKTVLGGGFNTWDGRFFTALDPEHGEPISQSTLNEQDQTSYNWIFTNTLNYNKSFGDHKVNALVGIEALKNGGKGKGVSRSGYLFETPDFYLLNNGSGAPNVDYAYDGWSSLWSIFGTANYNFQDRYYATATLRRDTSSRFQGDNQSDWFPSFSAGWVISNEDFWNGDSFIERLKLKGSWGQLGNQTLPASNPTINIYSLSESRANYPFNGNAASIMTGALLSSVGNPNLKWETSVTTNFGVELSMLNSKLNVSAEFFKIETKDLITRDFGLISSTAIDAGAPLVNLGDVENKGFDLAVSYGDETESGFSYDLSFNLSHYKNKVTNLINGAPVSGRGDLRTGAITRTEVGDEMSYFYGREVEGLDSNGRMIFADVNGDGSVNDDDRTKIGSPHPDFTYGLNASLAYKGFDAQIFFTGSQGNDIFNYSKFFTDFGGFVQGNRSDRVLDAWTPSNTDTNVPAVSLSYPSEGTNSNTYFVEDGSYLKLKNLQIGYTLPTSASDKIKAEAVRIYLQGTNLFTITDYQGFDPEVVAYGNLDLGIDSRLYPISQVFSLGANIKF